MVVLDFKFFASFGVTPSFYDPFFIWNMAMESYGQEYKLHFGDFEKNKGDLHIYIAFHCCITLKNWLKDKGLMPKDKNLLFWHPGLFLLIAYI